MDYRQAMDGFDWLRKRLEEDIHGPQPGKAVADLVTLDGLEFAYRQERKEANIDDLTGIGRRGTLERAYKRFLEGDIYDRRASPTKIVEGEQRSGEDRRHSQDYAIIFFDLDDFGKYNKAYGDRQGDEALRALGQYLNQRFRRTDGIEFYYNGNHVERYGGEEIAIFLAGADVADATRIAEEISEGIKRIDVPIVEGNVQAREGFEYPLERNRISASIGVAGSQFKDEVLDRVIDRAITAKNSAKDAGKGMVYTSFTANQVDYVDSAIELVA